MMGQLKFPDLPLPYTFCRIQYDLSAAALLLLHFGITGLLPAARQLCSACLSRVFRPDLLQLFLDLCLASGSKISDPSQPVSILIHQIQNVANGAAAAPLQAVK